MADCKVERIRGLSIQPGRSFKTSRNIIRGCEDLPDTNRSRSASSGKDRGMGRLWKSIPSGKKQWVSEPNVGRVAHGVPARVDRLKCLGNAVVPQQVYPILQAIAEIEIGA
jgi:DNA (cytosine-5)-methyltransferase 1